MVPPLHSNLHQSLSSVDCVFALQHFGGWILCFTCVSAFAPALNNNNSATSVSPRSIYSLPRHLLIPAQNRKYPPKQTSWASSTSERPLPTPTPPLRRAPTRRSQASSPSATMAALRPCTTAPRHGTRVPRSASGSRLLDSISSPWVSNSSSLAPTRAHPLTLTVILGAIGLGVYFADPAPSRSFPSELIFCKRDWA